MRRHRIAFVSGTFIILLLGSALASGIDAQKFEAAKRAAAEFVALAKGSETTGTMPRQSSPEVRALLDAIFDRAVLGTDVLPLSEGRIGELVVNSSRVGTLYLLAGTGKTDLSTLAADPQAVQRAEKNVGSFAPELGRWFDYQLWIAISLADSTNAFLDSATKDVLERPQVQSGLAKVRGGLAQALKGVLQTMGSAELDHAWRRDRLIALSEIAPKAARVLLESDAEAVKAQALQLGSVLKDPEIDIGLKNFAAVISSRAGAH